MKNFYLLFFVLVFINIQAQTVTPDIGFLGQRLTITISDGQPPAYIDYDVVSSTTSAKGLNLFNDLIVSGTSSLNIFNDLGEQLLVEAYKKISNFQISILAKIPTTATVGKYSISIPSFIMGTEKLYKDSFTVLPDAEFYTVKGKNTVCDNPSYLVPNLTFNISDGINLKTYILDKTGDFELNLPQGTHKITPVLTQSDYFTVTPPFVELTFPSIENTVTQNFCVAAKKIYDDVEVIVFPLGVARPGFDSKYRIRYKNKGLNNQSGTIDLQFNENLMDYVSSSPAFKSTEAHKIKWEFIDLKPFESREIVVTFNVNSPTEIPAVNNGDVLDFIANINIQNSDEIFSNNTFDHEQTVVGSYDPNDKTCLEGLEISKEQVGGYLNYQIRFENTGTYMAEKVVVVDQINTNLFDIQTLDLVSSSHNCIVKITNNVVEFVFDNINLPFDDANNDGYVNFRVKTNSNLNVGTVIANSANIYFDYNLPIITNTAETKVVSTLGTSDFEFSDQFSLYPNPTNHELNISAKTKSTITSMEIYNTIGQILLAIPNAQNTQKIDVSFLPNGTYILKANTSNGVSTIKFVKE